MNYQIIKDWTTEAGFRAVIIMGSGGYHCGYVGLSPGHPLFGCEYGALSAALHRPSDDEQVGGRSAISMLCASFDESRMQAPEMVFDVHGSLTYSGGNGKYPVESNLWWFGYDCGHYGDRPSDEYQEAMKAKYPDEPLMWSDNYGTFRDVAFCERECESLARQIVEKNRRTSMNWTAQDEAKWAELDARRTDVMRAREKALRTVVEKIAWDKQDGIVNTMIRYAAELRYALEPYDDRVSKQECSQPEKADDGWIEWNGGEQPIPNGSIADVKYRDGKVQFAMEIPYGDGQHEYIAYNWKHKGMNGDIIAYRPVK